MDTSAVQTSRPPPEAAVTLAEAVSSRHQPFRCHEATIRTCLAAPLSSHNVVQDRPCALARLPSPARIPGINKIAPWLEQAQIARASERKCTRRPASLPLKNRRRHRGRSAGRACSRPRWTTSLFRNGGCLVMAHGTWQGSLLSSSGNAADRSGRERRVVSHGQWPWGRSFHRNAGIW
jgi:hypothetical protein